MSQKFRMNHNGSNKMESSYLFQIIKFDSFFQISFCFMFFFCFRVSHITLNDDNDGDHYDHIMVAAILHYNYCYSHSLSIFFSYISSSFPLILLLLLFSFPVGRIYLYSPFQPYIETRFFFIFFLIYFSDTRVIISECHLKMSPLESNRTLLLLLLLLFE